jgi:peptidoglycan/LPS O-acetylase OafA/YrhL
MRLVSAAVHVPVEHPSTSQYEEPEMSMGKPDNYRADIDGLRAIAVIVVVIFHAFPLILPGGFIGVDVFFVLSGYLITSIILSRLGGDTFTLRDFYYRRIRRIFPALILVLAACTVLGRVYLIEEEFKELRREIFSGALFVSNFKYWIASGYFAPAAETQPLLHLWSLAVEEQFYLLWPVMLLLVWRWRLSPFWCAALLGTASFATNIVLVELGLVNAAFYSPASRFWELMVGAMLAARAPGQQQLGIGATQVLSVLGVSLIGAGLLVIDPHVRFPGWWALMPVLGTALVVAAGPTAAVNRWVLSNPIMVGIGLISYPLYLWHWPLLSFARILEGKTPPADVRLLVIIISVALAWATYRLLERPIRFAAFSSFRTAAALSAAMLLIVSVRFIVPIPTAGVNALEGEVGHEDFFAYSLKAHHLCTPDHIQKQSLREFWPARCLQSQPGEKKDLAIVGDSHAEDLFIGLAARMPAANVVSYIHALPIFETPGLKEALDYIVTDRNIQVVVMTAYWNLQTDLRANTGFSLKTELTGTVERLLDAGKTIYLIDDRPYFPKYVTACKRLPKYVLGTRRASACEFARSSFEDQRKRYLPVLTEIANKFRNVHLLSPNDVFCDEAVCWMARDGRLLYRDQSHLSIYGSRMVADVLAPQIRLEPRPTAGAGSPAPAR